MVDSTLSEAIKETYASAPSDTVILHTLEIRHPNFIDSSNNSTAIRVVNNYTDVLAKLESSAPLNPSQQVTFVSFSFSINLPTIDDKSNPEAIISIDNVSREIVENIDRAVTSQDVINVTYRPYLSTDLTAPSYDPPLHFILTDVVADVFKVTGRAKFPDLSNLSFPNKVYTPTLFPGLVR